jgi:heme/copper-type cytochrome/quinol oxidase subunit 2
MVPDAGEADSDEAFMTWAAWLGVLAVIVIGIATLALWRKPSEPRRDYTGLKHHAKVHSFRLLTAILAWGLIVAAFYYRPDLLKWLLRSLTTGIETIGDSLPSPWGDRAEVILRELGGFIWIQITAIIVLIRVVFSTIAMGWRLTRRNDAE